MHVNVQIWAIIKCLINAKIQKIQELPGPKFHGGHISDQPSQNVQILRSGGWCYNTKIYRKNLHVYFDIVIKNLRHRRTVPVTISHHLPGTSPLSPRTKLQGVHIHVRDNLPRDDLIV